MTSRSAKDYKGSTGVRARGDLTATPAASPLVRSDDPLTDEQLLATATYLFGACDAASQHGETTLILPVRTARKMARAMLEVCNRPRDVHA